MLQIYLLVNAFFYLLFALWCLLNVKGTSNTLGYSFVNVSGNIEYLSIYTGLEMGFAVFLGICAFVPDLRFAALLFLVCIYAGVMLVRPIAAIIYGNALKVTYWVGALEWILGIWGIVLLVLELKKQNLQG